MRVIAFMHIKQNTVPSIIYCIHGKDVLFHLSQLSEVEFPETATSLNQPREVYYFGEMYLHNLSLRNHETTIIMLGVENENKKLLTKLRDRKREGGKELSG